MWTPQADAAIGKETPWEVPGDVVSLLVRADAADEGGSRLEVL
jgi:hypothetical protein